MHGRLDRIGMTATLGSALSLFALLLSLVLLSPSFASGQPAPKRVLIFSSDDHFLPALTILNQSIRSTLKNGLQVPVQFFYEGQDGFRISNEKYEEELVRLLQRKYEGEYIDLIYAFSAPALRMLLKHQGELFPDVPIVFIVNDLNRVADLNLGTRVTGVSGKLELSPTLDIALALQSQTQKVVVVAGKATADTLLVEQAQREFRPYEGRVEFIYLTGLPLEELQQKLAGLPDKSIVFYLAVNSNTPAKIYENYEIISLLAPSSSAPIYGASQTYMGSGLIGGRLVDYEAMGTRAAEVGIRILAGESPQNIPPQTVPSAAMFDWRELRRWGISEQSLPPGSIVRFKQPTLWEEYKWRIVGIITLCVLEALLIAYLLITRARRRQAEQEKERFARLAEAGRRHLDEVVSNMPGVVWESRLEPGTDMRKAYFVSDYVENMLGYSVDEWLSSPDFVSSIVPEEDRQNVNRGIAAVIESGKECALRFRCRAKDGRLVWVETHVAPMHDEAGQTVGLRGVTLDITERKRDEQALQQLSGQLLMLQDEEQRRVAGELHDGLGQSLAIIKNRALIGLQDQTNHDRAIDQLGEIVETANAAILEVREIAHNLRPYQLDRLGLVAAIKYMIKRVAESTSLSLSVDMERIDSLLSREAETSVYRIVQEGLNNVVKHSSATTARVEIKKRGGKLAISIQDNGKGISPPAPAGNGAKGGVGLAGIAERVRLLGGSFTTDSHPSRGTTLTVLLELPSGAES